MKRHSRIYSTFRVVLMALFLTIVLTGFASISISAKAADKNEPKYYTSIRVESGDTLWSIAEEHAPAGVELTQYIDEIKEMNGLRTDGIRAGAYLMIYYTPDSL